MIFDQQSTMDMGEIIISPDWVFGDVPKSPNAIKETEYIQGQGATGSRIIRIKGSSDTNATWNTND